MQQNNQLDQEFTFVSLMKFEFPVSAPYLRNPRRRSEEG